MKLTNMNPHDVQYIAEVLSAADQEVDWGVTLTSKQYFLTLADAVLRAIEIREAYPEILRSQIQRERMEAYLKWMMEQEDMFEDGE